MDSTGSRSLRAGNMVARAGPEERKLSSVPEAGGTSDCTTSKPIAAHGIATGPNSRTPSTYAAKDRPATGQLPTNPSAHRVLNDPNSPSKGHVAQTVSYWTQTLLSRTPRSNPLSKSVDNLHAARAIPLSKSVDNLNLRSLSSGRRNVAGVSGGGARVMPTAQEPPVQLPAPPIQNEELLRVQCEAAELRLQLQAALRDKAAADAQAAAATAAQHQVLRELENARSSNQAAAMTSQLVCSEMARSISGTATLQVRITELQAQLDAALADAAEQREHAASQSALIDVLRAATEKYRQEAQVALALSEQAQLDVVALRQDQEPGGQLLLQEVRRSLAASQAREAEVGRAAEALRAELAHASDELDRVGAELAHANGKLDLMGAELAHANGELDRVGAELAQVRARGSTAREQEEARSEKLAKRVAELEAREVKLCSNEGALKAALKAKINEHEGLLSIIKDLTRQRSRAEADLQAQRAELDGAHKQLSDKAQALAACEQRCDELQQTLELLQARGYSSLGDAAAAQQLLRGAPQAWELPEEDDATGWVTATAGTGLGGGCPREGEAPDAEPRAAAGGSGRGDATGSGVQAAAEVARKLAAGAELESTAESRRSPLGDTEAMQALAERVATPAATGHKGRSNRCGRRARDPLHRAVLLIGTVGVHGGAAAVAWLQRTRQQAAV